MRVLYFTLDYTPHDFRFLSSLAQTDHEVFALRLEKKEIHKEDRQLPDKVTAVPWKGGRRRARLADGLSLIFDLKRVIKEIKPDLIHAGPIQKPALMAALAGFHPLVSMSWGSDLLVDSGRNSFWKAATRYTLSRTDILLGDCQAVKNKAQSLGFNPDDTVLFPWGIDLNKFQPDLSTELRNTLGWQDKFVILSLRSWEPIYGVDVVVKAFAEAAAQQEDLRLILLGNGSLAPMIQDLITSYHLQDKIYLGGQIAQDDLPSFYRAANLYISASHSDGSSVSLMEALACGVPPLVSDIPGNIEWITPGQDGWFFADGSVSSLKEGILKAYSQRSNLVQIGKMARELAVKRADWSKNFSFLLEAYETACLLEQKRRRNRS